MKTIAKYEATVNVKEVSCIKGVMHCRGRFISDIVLFMVGGFGQKGLNPNPPNQLKMSSLAFLDPVEAESEESLA